jgi:hypothetical protein
MAILRDSEPFRRQTDDTRKAGQWSGIGQAGASQGASQKRFHNNEGFYNALDRLGDTLHKGLLKRQQIDFDNAYLAGQAKAGIIQAEDEIQNDPLTRDFEVAGYRQAMAKLALAEEQQRFKEDLPYLRTLDAEGLEGYMTRRRNTLNPMLAGLAVKDRAAAAQQMADLDFSHTVQWKTERQKYIIDEKMAATTTQLAAFLQDMHEAQVQFDTGQIDERSYLTRMGSFTEVLKATWDDDSLPRQVKEQFTAQAFQSALQQGNTQLYDILTSQKFDNNIGSEEVDGPNYREASTFLARLPQETQNQLAGMYAQAEQKRSWMKNFQGIQTVADLRAQIHNEAYTGNLQDFDRLTKPLIHSGAMSVDEYQQMRAQLQYVRKTADEKAFSPAPFLSGNLMELLANGTTPEKAAQATVQQMAASGASPAQILDAMTTAAKNGMVAAAGKQIGQMADVAMQSVLSNDGKVLSQHKEMLDSIIQKMDDEDKSGNVYYRQTIMAGMSPEMRGQFEGYMKKLKAGKSVEVALSEIAKDEAAAKAMPAEARAARAAQLQDVYSKADAMVRDHRGLFATMWLKAGALLGGEQSAAELKLRTSDWAFEDNHFKTRIYQNAIQGEVREAIKNIAMANPSYDGDSVMDLALADVASRTIETKWGPVPLPQGFYDTFASKTGLGPGQQSMLGKAIDNLTRAGHEDGYVHVKVDSNGRLMADSYDKSGNMDALESHELSPELIRDEVKRLTDAEAKYNNAVYGDGYKADGKGGSVIFNGANAAGVPHPVMFAVRWVLSKFEGVTDTPYQDGKFKSVGVGINEQNPHYPESARKTGKASPEDINKSFAAASEAAVKSAKNILEGLGMNVGNSALLEMASSMAYQGGEGFAIGKTPSAKAGRAMLEAVKEGDYDKALAEFKKTAVYKVSPEDRRRYYVARLHTAATSSKVQ